MGKLQSLVSQIDFFYKVALYGDRKAFLETLAQGKDTSTIMAAKNEIMQAAHQQWSKDPAQFPMAAREAFNVLAYDADVKSLNQAGLQKLKGAVRNLYSVLMNSNNEDNVAFANSLYPQIENLNSQINQHMEWLGTVMPSEEKGSGKLDVEPTTITGTSPKSQEQRVNALLGTVNMFVRKLGPSTPDNTSDPNRSKALKQLNDHTLAELLNVYKSLGASSDNPYAAPQDQKLASKIEAAFDQVGQAFSMQINELPNYAAFKHV
jgi:hypothetical protein